jgi:tryptophan halogenase
MGNGTKYKSGDVKSLNKNSENGKLESINLADGSTIDADFWIDCSGFSKALIKEMDGGWVSYENSLPVNAALPYLHQYKSDEDVWAETLAWAQNSGWMWQIPTQTRYGCGYVYCDKFVNEDQALAELEKTTGRKIDPIRNIKFDVGRLNKFWVNNVVAVGLSSGFLEPLQATSIHTTILQMELLMNVLGEEYESYKPASIFYNDYIAKIYDDNRDLLQLHYLTDREDTPFWKFCKYELEKTQKVQYVRDISKFKSPSFLEFSLEHGGASWAVWCWTIMGLDIVDKNIAWKTLQNNSSENDAKSVFENLPRQHSIQSISLMKNKDFLRALRNKNLNFENSK